MDDLGCSHIDDNLKIIFHQGPFKNVLIFEVYLFWETEREKERERERERECGQGRARERGREKESQAGSMLSAEPKVELNLMNCDIMA